MMKDYFMEQEIGAVADYDMALDKLCVIVGCHRSPDIGSDQPDRCEYHHVTWGGVYDGECDCYQGVDNADVDVCYKHRRAYERDRRDQD